jgi:medium-chain acyl-[acyl-carrier-protein] hydrolase
LAVSARIAPHLPPVNFDTFYGLDDQEFLDKLLARYQGIPKVILETPELLERALPALRADMEVYELYQPIDGPEKKVACPIAAYGGKQDRFSQKEGLEAWREYTDDAFSLDFFDGDHFYLANSAGFDELFFGRLEALL